MHWYTKTHVVGRWQLRSADSGTLVVPRTRTTAGRRDFAVSGPATWNSLPVVLRTSSLSKDTVVIKLKTHLFGCQHLWGFPSTRRYINLRIHSFIHSFIDSDDPMLNESHLPFTLWRHHWPLSLIQPASKCMHWATLRRHSDLFWAATSTSSRWFPSSTSPCRLCPSSLYADNLDLS